MHTAASRPVRAAWHGHGAAGRRRARLSAARGPWREPPGAQRACTVPALPRMTLVLRAESHREGVETCRRTSASHEPLVRGRSRCGETHPPEVPGCAWPCAAAGIPQGVHHRPRRAHPCRFVALERRTQAGGWDQRRGARPRGATDEAGGAPRAAPCRSRTCGRCRAPGHVGEGFKPGQKIVYLSAEISDWVGSVYGVFCISPRRGIFQQYGRSMTMKAMLSVVDVSMSWTLFAHRRLGYDRGHSS